MSLNKNLCQYWIPKVIFLQATNTIDLLSIMSNVVSFKHKVRQLLLYALCNYCRNNSNNMYFIVFLQKELKVFVNVGVGNPTKNTNLVHAFVEIKKLQKVAIFQREILRMFSYLQFSLSFYSSSSDRYSVLLVNSLYSCSKS